MTENKRIYDRVIDPRVKVIYKPFNLAAKEEEVNALNIGIGGLGLPCRHRLKVGTILEISIMLPEDNEPILGLAKTAWQDGKKSISKNYSEYYSTGLRFIKLGIANRKRLSKYISLQLKAQNQAADNQP